MEDTTDDTKPLVRRLTSSQRLLAILLLTGTLLLTVAGAGLAAQGDAVLINDTKQDPGVDVHVGPHDSFVYSGGESRIHKFDLSDNSTVYNISTATSFHEYIHADTANNSYFVGSDVVSLDENGAQRWSTNPTVASITAMDYNNTTHDVIVGGSGGGLFVLNAETGNTETSIADFTSNSVVSIESYNEAYYLGLFNNQIQKTNRSGDVHWSVSETGENPAFIDVGPSNETVYVAYATGTGEKPSVVTARDTTDGGEVWNNTLGADIFDMESGSGGEFVYATTTNGTKVVALDADTGEEVWNYSHNRDPEGFDTNVKGGTGYFNDQAGHTYQLDLGSPTNIDTGIRGTVTDEENTPLSGVTINATEGNDSRTTTTNNLGEYDISLENGTYTVTATLDGYTDGSKTAVVAGNNTKVDFELQNLSSGLLLKVNRRFLEHNDSTGYEVYDINETGDTVDRELVTDNATVTSNDTDILTVDGDAHELVATGNQSVNANALVTAEYQNKSGNETVFVGSITLDNFAKLPPMGRLDAVIGSNVDADEADGANATSLLLVLAALTGAALRRAASTYAGLAGFQMIIIAGWIMGKTGNGVLLISLVAVGFVGLNLAANIDYGFASR